MSRTVPSQTTVSPSHYTWVCTGMHRAGSNSLSGVGKGGEGMRGGE